MASGKIILVVHHGSEFRVALVDFLQDAGFTVWQTSTAADALDRVRAPGQLPHLLLIELGLSGGGGLALVRALRESRARDVPIVGLTGFDPDQWRRSLDFPAVAKWQVDRLLAVLAAVKTPSPAAGRQASRGLRVMH